MCSETWVVVRRLLTNCVLPVERCWCLIVFCFAYLFSYDTCYYFSHSLVYFFLSTKIIEDFYYPPINIFCDILIYFLWSTNTIEDFYYPAINITRDSLTDIQEILPRRVDVIISPTCCMHHFFQHISHNLTPLTADWRSADKAEAHAHMTGQGWESAAE